MVSHLMHAQDSGFISNMTVIAKKTLSCDIINSARWDLWRHNYVTWHDLTFFEYHDMVSHRIHTWDSGDIWNMAAFTQKGQLCDSFNSARWHLWRHNYLTWPDLMIFLVPRHGITSYTYMRQRCHIEHDRIYPKMMIMWYFQQCTLTLMTS